MQRRSSPIVLREAFASGRPLIATKVGDVPEIIQGEQNGLMVEPGDSGALAAAILRFLSEPSLAAQCAAAGLRYAREHFSFDRMMESKIKIDAAVVASPAPGASASAHQSAPAELISSKR